MKHFCEQMKEVGNLSLSISLEGFEEVNDLRRGAGVYEKVLHAMDLLKASGQIFGTSICYTSKNIETVTSDEFLDMIIEKGCRFTWYFHYMPVGNDAAVELLPTKKSRENICITEFVRFVPRTVENLFLLWTSRMMVNL